MSQLQISKTWVLMFTTITQKTCLEVLLLSWKCMYFILKVIYSKLVITLLVVFILET